jgi:putative endonuclease
MSGFMERWFGPGAAGETGGEGERFAADWLRRERGFSVVCRNWRNPHDRREEIDLVCRDREALVFVEVKARAAGALVPGYYAVDARKKRVLRRAARSYLRQLHPRPTTYRFDVVEIQIPGRGSGAAPVLLHFEGVPLFPKLY